jgi:hypothetical protein
MSCIQGASFQAAKLRFQAAQELQRKALQQVSEAAQNAPSLVSPSGNATPQAIPAVDNAQMASALKANLLFGGPATKAVENLQALRAQAAQQQFALPGDSGILNPVRFGKADVATPAATDVLTQSSKAPEAAVHLPQGAVAMAEVADVGASQPFGKNSQQQPTLDWLAQIAKIWKQPGN